MVTGVSTGALTAPFAFLGPDYDDKMKEVYTTGSWLPDGSGGVSLGKGTTRLYSSPMRPRSVSGNTGELPVLP